MARFLLLVLCTLILSTQTFAQENEDEKVIMPGFSAHVGSLLPNQVENVTEVLPMWGLRYSFPYRKKSLLEIGASAAQAEGITYYMGSISMRADYPVEDLVMIAYIGADIHRYQYSGSSEFLITGGGHVGGGFMAHIGDLIWFRSEMKFNINPGTSLYVGFGFEMRFPDTEENKEN